MYWRDTFWATGQGLGIGLWAVILWRGMALLLLQFPSHNGHLYKLCLLVFAFLAIVIFADIAAGIDDKFASLEEAEEYTIWPR